MIRTMNNLKESFTIMKAITTRKTTLKMTILCHAISMLFKNPYNTPLINLDRLVITGKYQTSYCQDLGLICSRNDRS